MGVAVEPPALQGSKWWLDGHDGRPALPNATHTWKPAQLNRTGAQRYTLGGNGVPQVIGRVLRAYSHDAKWEKWADPAAFRLVERFNPGVEKKDPKTGVSRVVRVGEQFSIPYNEKRPLVSTTAHLLRVPLRLGGERAARCCSAWRTSTAASRTTGTASGGRRRIAWASGPPRHSDGDPSTCTPCTR